MSQSPSSERPDYAATLESTVLVLAERMAGVQRELGYMSAKVDRMSAEQATRVAMAELSGQIKTLQDQTESRIRSIENWKTGVEARVDLVAGQWKFICAVAGLISIGIGIISHYWK